MCSGGVLRVLGALQCSGVGLHYNTRSYLQKKLYLQNNRTPQNQPLPLHAVKKDSVVVINYENKWILNIFA